MARDGTDQPRCQFTSPVSCGDGIQQRAGGLDLWANRSAEPVSGESLLWLGAADGSDAKEFRGMAERTLLIEVAAPGIAASAARDGQDTRNPVFSRLR